MSDNVGVSVTSFVGVQVDPDDNVALVGAATVGAGTGGGGGGGGAPTDATYLVTASNATLSAEIVVGATPGGELGGTWQSPTVDATHSGSSHASVQAAAEAAAAVTSAAQLAVHTADTTDAHDASAISVTDTLDYYDGSDVETVLGEIGAVLGDFVATPVDTLRKRVGNSEFMSLSSTPDSAEATSAATIQNLIMPLKGRYSSYHSQMRAANPNLEILVYMNFGEAQEDQGPTDGPGGTPYYSIGAYCKDVKGNYVLNNDFGNYLMNPTHSAWETRCVSDAISFMSQADADGVIGDVVGPGPTRWPSGSYSGRPVYTDSGGTISPSTTLTGSVTSTTTSIPVANRSAFPQSGTFWIAVWHSSDTEAEIMQVNSGHGTGAGTFIVSSRSANNYAHANGATVVRAWDDSEWMTSTGALAGVVKAGLPAGTPLLVNGLGKGTQYFGTFSGSGEAAAKPIMSGADGGMAENFVRDNGDAIASGYRSAAYWKLDVDMLVDATASGKRLCAVSKTWVTATQPQLDAWNIYCFASFLLGCGPLSRFMFIPQHVASFDQGSYDNPLYDVPMGDPTGAYGTQGSGSTAVYTRQYSNGFVAVNPQTTSNDVVLPRTMYAWDDTAGATPISGTVTLSANTGMIWVDDPTPTTSFASAADLQAHIDATSDAHPATAVTVDSTSLAGTGTDLQTVLEEIDAATGSGLTSTSVKTADYTAAVGELVLMSATGAWDVRLPDADTITDGDEVGVLVVSVTGTNKITVVPGSARGTPVDTSTLSYANASAKMVLANVGSFWVYRYNAQLNVWHPRSLNIGNIPRSRTYTGASPTLDANYDMVSLTVGQDTTLNAPGGTVADGHLLVIRLINDASGTRNLTWNAVFAAVDGATLPASITGTNTVKYVPVRWNNTTSKWEYRG